MAYLAESTGQDRKTVLANLCRLRDLGHIEDTGSRVGKTKQIVVYRLNINGSGAANKDTQKWNSSENGTVPKTDGNSTVFPAKEARFSREQSQKRDTEPSITISNRKSNKQDQRPDASALDFSSWPTAPAPKLLSDWLAVRRKKRADVSETVIAAMGRELHLAAGMGWTVDECLTECVLRNWQGLKADWLEPKRSSPPIASKQQVGKTMGAILALEEMKRGLDQERNCDGSAATALLGFGSPTGR
jgi:hypothetical protein